MCGNRRGLRVGTFIIIIIVVGIAWAAVVGMKLKKQRQAEDNTFFGEHQGWDIYVSAHDRGVVALDHKNRQMVVGKVTNHGQLPWSEITGVEIEKNGQTISQTNRGSQAMGAAVGAVLLGPVGLLMGGLTGSKRNKERVNELTLKIMIDDPLAPVHRVVFFRMQGSGIDAKSAVLKEPARQLEHYHALISNAIRADRRSFSQQPQQPAQIGDGVESRIAKLWDLHQAGALSVEEFTSGKQAILAGTRSLT
ncbi:hypothetical protein EAH79_11475 [Sphingomonas koreensis]|nr:hypothetical protein EAH79_11475 [Sphingomonas koreensis]